VAAGRKRKGDAELVLALACGASPENAAQKAGLSRRTVYRRLAAC
jgi:transcriptional regulator of acetoin/glycerol metabolism